MKALNLKSTLFIRIFSAVSIIFVYGSVLTGTSEWTGFLSVKGGKTLGSKHPLH